MKNNLPQGYVECFLYWGSLYTARWELHETERLRSLILDCPRPFLERAPIVDPEFYAPIRREPDDLDAAMTFDEIAIELGLSRARVQQIEQIALRKLRAFVICQLLGYDSKDWHRAVKRREQQWREHCLANRTDRPQRRRTWTLMTKVRFR